MNRKPQAIRRPASSPLHRIQRRRAWERIRPWLEDFAALAATLLFVASFWGILALLSVPNAPP